VVWPPLPYHDWQPTKETLHRYAQILGKVRMSLVPFRNHWWHVTLYVSTRGVTTGPMPYGDLVKQRVQRFASFEDLDRYECTIEERETGNFPSRPNTLRPFAISSGRRGRRCRTINRNRSTSPTHPLFPDDLSTTVTTPDAVERSGRSFGSPSTRWPGSPDSRKQADASLLAQLRPAHSLRPSAPPVGGADPVNAEAYSREVIAFGWWPGDDRTTPYPAYYSYTWPEPDGLRGTKLLPPEAQWQAIGNGSLAVLPYDVVREAADPAAALLGFYESAYHAGATLASWDLALLGD
jgi:hypothetical protein